MVLFDAVPTYYKNKNQQKNIFVKKFPYFWEFLRFAPCLVRYHFPESLWEQKCKLSEKSAFSNSLETWSNCSGHLLHSEAGRIVFVVVEWTHVLSQISLLISNIVDVSKTNGYLFVSISDLFEREEITKWEARARKLSPTINFLPNSFVTTLMDSRVFDSCSKIWEYFAKMAKFSIAGSKKLKKFLTCRAIWFALLFFWWIIVQFTWFNLLAKFQSCRSSQKRVATGQTKSKKSLPCQKLIQLQYFYSNPTYCWLIDLKNFTKAKYV